MPRKKSELDSATVKDRMADGMSIAEIAAEFGVTTQTVRNRLREERTAKNMINVSARQPIVWEHKGHSLAQKEETAAKITNFVQYHMAMLQMREGCNKKDVPDLYQRFYRYLQFCAENGIFPNSMNAYFAVGISRADVSQWHLGKTGTPEHKEFADTIMDFFASVHEQAGGSGIVNPILSIYWSKAHDGMVEASKVEVVQPDPLGDRQSSEQIAAKYREVDLPD